MSANTISLKVNAEPILLPAGSTIVDLLRQKGIEDDVQGVAVGVNGELVNRANWDTHTLKPDDAVDIVHAQQGG